MVLAPCRSKKAWALVTFCCLKKRLSGRLNRPGPTLRPNQKPTWSPITAAANATNATTGRVGRRLPPASEARKPPTNSSESPGRKKPMSRPDSAKMIDASSARPPLSRIDSGFRKLASTSDRMTGRGYRRPPPLPGGSPRAIVP